jgi:hypothetical protein
MCEYGSPEGEGGRRGRALPPAERESAEAEEAYAEHRPGRGLGNGAAHDGQVENRAAAPPGVARLGRTGGAVQGQAAEAAQERAVGPQEVEGVARGEMETAGEIDAEAAVERRGLGDAECSTAGNPVRPFPTGRNCR